MVNQLDLLNLPLSDKRRHTDIRFYVKGILGDSYLNYSREKAAQLLKSMTSKQTLRVMRIRENLPRFFAKVHGIPPLKFRRLSK